MASSSVGIIEPERFLEALQKARDGQEVSTLAIIRTLGVDHRLTNLNRYHFLVGKDKDA